MSLIKQNQINEVAEFWQSHKSKFDEFSKKLGTKPKQTSIKTNAYANNSKYLEIGYLELQLDRIFHGQWNLHVEEVKLMLNAISVTVTIEVLHPVSGTWIKRSGVAAKQVTLAKDKKDFLIENLSAKTLERDLPIAKAEAFKNAVKSLGNSFGRHLNREFNFDFIEDKEDIFSIKLKQE